MPVFEPCQILEGCIVITGGALNKKDAWVVTDYAVIDNSKYIELSRSNRKLQRFIGVPGQDSSPLAKNGFLDKLTRLRNAAVDDATFEFMKKQDPIATDSSALKAKAIDNMRKTMDVSDVPASVTLKLDAISHELPSGARLEADTPSRSSARQCCCDAAWCLLSSPLAL